MKIPILMFAACLNASGQSSIFAPSTVPGSSYNGGGITVGLKFYADVSGSVTALRFYKPVGATGTHTGLLYSATGTLLAQANYTETASGWQQVAITPVALTANQIYIVAYFTTGLFSYDSYYWPSGGVNVPPLHVPGPDSVGDGLYLYGPSPQFPTTVNPANQNDYADVVFTPSGIPAGPGVVTSPVPGASVSLSASPWPGAPPTLTIQWGALAAPYTSFTYCIDERTPNCYSLPGQPGDGRSWNPSLPNPREAGQVWGNSLTTSFAYLTPNVPHTIYLTVQGSPGWNGVNMNNVLLTQMVFTVTILQDLPTITTYNTKTTQVYYPPTDPVPDDYTGGTITLNALQRRWKVTRGHIVIPRADNIDVGTVTYAKPEGAADGGFRYSYSFDNRQAYLVRIGDIDILNLRPTASTQPEGWFGLTTGWAVQPLKTPARSQQAEYSIITKYRPGLIPLHIAGPKVAQFSAPEEGLTQTELEFAAEHSSIMVNSRTEYVIGPAFKPDATPTAIKETIGRWVADYGMTFLQPYLDAGRLDAVQPSNQLERDVLDCLRAIL